MSHSKTKLLLTLAYRRRDSSNIFFLNTKDTTLLQQEYLLIANRVGSDILATYYPNQDLYALWRALHNSERIEFFKRWLGETKTKDTVLVFDDIDGLPQPAIAEAIP
jgi:hypothetical protein